MGYSEVLETRGRLRVRIEIEEGPPEPYDDMQSPLLRIDPQAYRVEHIQAGSRPAADDERIEEAVRHWATTPSDSDWALFEKYLRAYYGVTQIVTYWSESYWYVTYDSKAWRDAVGAPEGGASLDEYRAWCEGEVYGWVIEKRVTWRAVDPVTDDPDYSEYPDRDTWEPADNCGTFYGDKWAKEAAMDAFKEALEAEGGDCQPS